MSLQYLRKEARDEVDFLHADKHQSFLLVAFSTLDIGISYKVMPSLSMGVIKGCARYIFASLFYISKKREIRETRKKDFYFTSKALSFLR